MIIAKQNIVFSEKASKHVFWTIFLPISLSFLVSTPNLQNLFEQE